PAFRPLPSAKFRATFQRLFRRRLSAPGCIRIGERVYCVPLPRTLPRKHTMATTDHGPRTTGHLERVLGPWMATALVVGTVIGSGVFKKPAAVAQSVPTFGWAIAAWVILGLLVLCGGLALTEVIMLYPRAGGNYVF